MKNLDRKTVAEVVTENIRTAHIFKKYGIDFCCGGSISIKKVCLRNNIDYSLLEQDLLNIDKVPNTYNYNSWKLDFLIDHIINVHHSYVKESIPLIMEYAKRVSEVHGHHYSVVLEVEKLFINLARELNSHLKKEEQILFPYIKSLIKTKNNEENFNRPSFGSVNSPIAVMELEHELAGDIFKRIAKLTNSYVPPKEACNTFRALYSKLEEFENDLHQHIHLENNILHPKAKTLENSLLN